MHHKEQRFGKLWKYLLYLLFSFENCVEYVCVIEEKKCIDVFQKQFLSTSASTRILKIKNIDTIDKTRRSNFIFLSEFF